MRIVASCALLGLLVVGCQAACNVEYYGGDLMIGNGNPRVTSFIDELAENAFHGLDEHDYAHDKLVQFVKDRMESCFPGPDVSVPVVNQPAVYSTHWEIQLVPTVEGQQTKIDLGFNLGYMIFQQKCCSWFICRAPYYLMLEQRLVSKASATTPTTTPERSCDVSLPEGRAKWCRRIPYFFTRFKC